MIEHFRVQNYKALRDVSLDLTPIHVLIGPNDTGKTSILEAITALCRTVDYPFAHAFPGAWHGRELVWHGDPGAHISFAANLSLGTRSFEYSLACDFLQSGRNANVTSEVFREPDQQPVKLQIASWPFSRIHNVVHGGEQPEKPILAACRLVHDALAGATYYRWDSEFLSLPTAPDSSRRFQMDSTGFGLALCLDDILGYDRDRFIAMENRFRQIFTNIRSIKLRAEPAYRAPIDPTRYIPVLQHADGKGIYVQFTDSAELVPASQLSDGVLLVLAYLTLLYLPQPPRVILVEEPENGIHPKRLNDVLNILKELVAEQSHSQIVMTTHSPYVVDLFKPEEVSLCKKEDDGSISVHRLSESQSVREQLDVFTLGEIWTAEGDDKLAQSAEKGEDKTQ